MKVLVATLGFGEGHNKAGEAVAEEVLDEFPGAEVEVVDFLYREKNFFDGISIFLYFVFVKYFPAIYQALYGFFSPNEFFHDILCSNYVHKMERFLARYPADVIISTHALCARASCVLKEKRPGIKAVRGVLTDFIDDRYWSGLRLDSFRVATDELRAGLMSKGVGKEMITVAPMPVRKEFRTGKGKAEACENIDSRIDPRLYTVLVLGGGEGLGGLARVARCLADLPVQIIVVAGRNKRVREELEELLFVRSNLFVFGFVDNMSDLMDASDICVTKPGGMTISECMAKNLPMAICGSPIPGPEAENVGYLVRNGLSEFYPNLLELRAAVSLERCGIGRRTSNLSWAVRSA